MNEEGREKEGKSRMCEKPHSHKSFPMKNYKKMNVVFYSPCANSGSIPLVSNLSLSLLGTVDDEIAFISFFHS